ncbi:MAG: LCP family protein, partial [Nocardioides sp.]
LPGTLAVTFLGALVPGGGLLWTGRRLLGVLVLLPTLALVGFSAWYVARDLDAALDLVLDPTRLKVAAGVIVGALSVWALIVYLTYRQVRPVQRRAWTTLVGHAFVLALVGVVGAPFAVAARYATVQADLVETVFSDNETSTTPRDVTPADPWGGRERVNVLLLGGDGGEGRDGVRTDTVILVSIDTTSGKTVMFSLPRNMMNAQFPEDSPLHDLYPYGFSGYGDDGSYMLNAIYRNVPALHPGVLGESTNEGADAIKQAVGGSLGIGVDYYVLVNLKGFQEIVDAIGGITVNVNTRVAINGNTDAGIPPTGWIEPGPDQTLDGFHALWFARGRYGSDDYQRMDRQRCTVAAIIEAADPVTLVRRYTALAAAGKEVVYSDIPQSLLPAFAGLALRMKDAKVRSVVFKTSASFFSGDPDFDYLRDTVAKAIDPPGTRRKRDDPARPKNTANSCAYDPA